MEEHARPDNRENGTQLEERRHVPGEAARNRREAKERGDIGEQRLKVSPMMICLIFFLEFHLVLSLISLARRRTTPSVKQVISVNDSLRLPPGKLAVQVAHAAIATFLATSLEIQEKWMEEGMPKIVLGVSHEETLLQLFAAAQQAHLPTYLVRDAGKTILPAGMITCLGIGPAPAADVDALTGNLALLP
jgi:PTH2 family peptidyl-tRNA hydrolase